MNYLSVYSMLYMSNSKLSKQIVYISTRMSYTCVSIGKCFFCSFT